MDEELQPIDRRMLPQKNRAVTAFLLAGCILLLGVAAVRGVFEPFMTTSIFDGTAQNPEWLGEEPQRVQQLMSM